jgi:hypothetical protein
LPAQAKKIGPFEGTSREPDPGSQGYVERVYRDGWTQQDVERDLRKSAEYRSKHH